MNAAEKAMQATKMQNAATIQKKYHEALELISNRKFDKAAKLLCDCVDMEHEESLDALSEKIIKDEFNCPHQKFGGGLQSRVNAAVRNGGERGNPSCLGVLKRFPQISGGMNEHWDELAEKRYEEAEEQYVRVLLNYKTYADDDEFKPEKLNEEDEALYNEAAEAIRKLDYGFIFSKRYTEVYRDADWGNDVDDILSRYPKAVRKVTGK